MEILQQLQKEFGGEIKSGELHIENLVLIEVLGFIFIDGVSGSFYPEAARFFIKGQLYDKLKYKFDMLEKEYYRLQEENHKAQLETIELSSLLLEE